jgi:hypothetical protein
MQGLFNTEFTEVTEVTERAPMMDRGRELLGRKKERAAGWLPLLAIRGITRNRLY